MTDSNHDAASSQERLFLAPWFGHVAAFALLGLTYARRKRLQQLVELVDEPVEFGQGGLHRQRAFHVDAGVAQ